MSDFVDQRSCIKFCVRNRISAAETLRMFQKAFGDQALPQTRTLEWHKMFREGGERVGNKERPRREKTSADKQHVMETKYLVLQNRPLTIRDLADIIGISRGSVNTVLKDILAQTTRGFSITIMHRLTLRSFFETFLLKIQLT